MIDKIIILGVVFMWTFFLAWGILTIRIVFEELKELINDKVS